jgi:gliding motility-associated-like protein
MVILSPLPHFYGGDVIIVTTDVGNVTEVSLAEELPDNTTIYVTIHPYNAGGITETCPEESFTTEDNTVVVDNSQKFGFSPDGDGVNEFWEIKGIRSYPDNVVSIYNRWGDLVFEIKGYDNASNVFRGSANKSTGRGAGELPEGTYFFTIDIPVEHNLKNRGYVVLKR